MIAFHARWKDRDGTNWKIRLDDAGVWMRTGDSPWLMLYWQEFLNVAFPRTRGGPAPMPRTESTRRRKDAPREEESHVVRPPYVVPAQPTLPGVDLAPPVLRVAGDE